MTIKFFGTQWIPIVHYQVKNQDIFYTYEGRMYSRSHLSQIYIDIPGISKLYAKNKPLFSYAKNTLETTIGTATAGDVTATSSLD